MKSTDTGLKNQVKKAAAWGYFGLLGRIVIQLGSQVALARLVGPEEYGAFAVGAIVVGVANFVADGGIGAAIVQRKITNRDELEFISTLQVITGAATFAVIWIASPILAALFNANSKAVEIIRLLGLVCLATSLGSVSQNILRKNLDFRRIQISQLVGMTIGYIVVGLPIAYLGGGVWSLGLAWVAQSIATTALLFNYTRPPVGIRFWCDNGRAIAWFGVSALVSNLSTWLGTGVDKMVVGFRYSPLQLSTYNVASNLIYTAASQLLSTAQQLIFSFSAKDAENRSEELKKMANLLIETGVLIFFPFMICIAISAEVIVLTLYGSSWIDAANVLSPAALTMAFYGISGLLTPLLWSTGSVSSDAKMQFVGVLLVGTAASIAATQKDPSAVAWAVLPCVALKTIWTIRMVKQSMQLKTRTIVRSFYGGGMASIILGAIFGGAIQLTRTLDMAIYQQAIIVVLLMLIILPIVIATSVFIAGTRELKDILEPLFERGKVFLREVRG